VRNKQTLSPLVPIQSAVTSGNPEQLNHPAERIFKDELRFFKRNHKPQFQRLAMDWFSGRKNRYFMRNAAGPRGNSNPGSQANGAILRVSPLEIFGAKFDLNQVAKIYTRHCVDMSESIIT